MRTTIDLPEDLFREAKTRAVQQGTTLKNLMIQYVRSGLRAQPDRASPISVRRNPPPVAIPRIPGHPMAPALSNRQLNAILEADEVSASRVADPCSPKLS